MLSTKRLYRLGVALVVGTLLLISGPPQLRAGAVRDGDRVVPPATPKGLVAAAHIVERAAGKAVQDCPLGQPDACHDGLGTAALNPGSFFDRTAGSDVSHYFMKLYINDTGGPVTIEGMGFESTSSDPRFNRFQAAGGIYAGPDALFPNPEALLALPVVEITGASAGNATCVEFPNAIDTRGNTIGTDLTLEPGDAAWLVLRFIATPAGVFVGIVVDDDSNDQPCDYMTIDGGDNWFRPDPLHGPAFDWGITAFVATGARTPDPAPPTWSTVKKLYAND